MLAWGPPMKRLSPVVAAVLAVLLLAPGPTAGAAGAASPAAAAGAAAGGGSSSGGTGPTATTGVPGTTTAGAAPGTTPGQAPQPTPSAAPAPAVSGSPVLAAAKSKDSDAGIPAPLLALAVVAGLMALGALLYGLARWWAWEPRWLVRTRHAGAEAGWRASGSWAEFLDWVRLGR